MHKARYIASVSAIAILFGTLFFVFFLMVFTPVDKFDAKVGDRLLQKHQLLQAAVDRHIANVGSPNLSLKHVAESVLNVNEKDEILSLVPDARLINGKSIRVMLMVNSFVSSYDCIIYLHDAELMQLRSLGYSCDKTTKDSIYIIRRPGLNFFDDVAAATSSHLSD